MMTISLEKVRFDTGARAEIEAIVATLVYRIATELNFDRDIVVAAIHVADEAIARANLAALAEDRKK